MNPFKTTMLAAAIALGMGAGVAQASDSTVGQKIDDASITAQVKTKLLADERTKGFDINVDTSHGVVTLTGGADTQDAKETAGKLAAQVKGVTGVHDNLIVAAPGTEARQDANTATASGEMRENMEEAGDAVDDAWITGKVKAQLLADKQVKGTKIEVETQGNVVTLTGTVPNTDVRSKAIEIASTTKGVKSVNADQLLVKTSSY